MVMPTSHVLAYGEDGIADIMSWLKPHDPLKISRSSIGQSKDTMASLPRARIVESHITGGDLPPTDSYALSFTVRLDPVHTTHFDAWSIYLNTTLLADLKFLDPDGTFESCTNYRDHKQYSFKLHRRPDQVVSWEKREQTALILNVVGLRRGRTTFTDPPHPFSPARWQTVPPLDRIAMDFIRWEISQGDHCERGG